MSIFDFFTSKAKVVDDVFDKDSGLLVKVGGFLNNLHYSDAEKQTDARELGKSVQLFAVATLDENTDRSKARRTIAVEWFKLQIWLIKLTVLTVFIDYLILKLDGADPKLSNSIAEIAFSPMLWGITGAVSVFFFGSHMLRSSKFSK